MNATLLERIQKLLAKTTEAGCTEAEAASAFALASRLMAENDLDMATVRSHAGPGRYGAGTAHVDQERDYIFDCAASLAERYFNVRASVLRPHAGGVEYILYGTREDFEVASFVFHRLVASCGAGWERFRVRFRSKDSTRNSYVMGFMKAVESRIAEQRASLDRDRPGSGRELATIRSRLDEAFDRAVGGVPERKSDSLAPREDEVDLLATVHGLHDGRKAAINREVEA